MIFGQTNIYPMLSQLDSKDVWTGFFACLLYQSLHDCLVSRAHIHGFVPALYCEKPDQAFFLFAPCQISFSSFGLGHCLNFTTVTFTWHVKCSQLCVQHGNQQNVRRWKIRYDGAYEYLLEIWERIPNINKGTVFDLATLAQSPLSRPWQLVRHHCVLTTVRPRRSFARAPSSQTAMRPSSPGHQ